MRNLMRCALSLVAGFAMLGVPSAYADTCEDFRNEAGMLAAQVLVKLDELVAADDALDRARAAMNESERSYDAAQTAVLDALARGVNDYYPGQPYVLDDQLLDRSLLASANQGLVDQYRAALARVDALTNTVATQYQALALTRQGMELACGETQGSGAAGSVITGGGPTASGPQTQTQPGGAVQPAPAASGDVVTNISDCRALMHANSKRTLKNWGPLIGALERCRTEPGQPYTVFNFCTGRAYEGEIIWSQCVGRTGHEALKKTLAKTQRDQRSACETYGGSRCDPVLVMVLPKVEGQPWPSPGDYD